MYICGSVVTEPLQLPAGIVTARRGLQGYETAGPQRQGGSRIAKRPRINDAAVPQSGMEC